jgi:hypothetical protein
MHATLLGHRGGIDISLLMPSCIGAFRLATCRSRMYVRLVAFANDTRDPILGYLVLRVRA